jgi:multiple sugar transport system substrate-binding protein
MKAAFSRRTFLVGMLEAASVAALAACGGTAAAPSPSTAQKGPQSVAGKTIVYLDRTGTAENFLTQMAIPQFEQKTGAKVVFNQLDANDLFTKVTVLAAANQLPDLVFGYDTPWTQLWAAQKLLHPLNDYAKADGYKFDQFYPAAITAVTFKKDNQVYALPTTGHAGCVQLYFNKTLMQQAGVQPPDAKLPDDAWKWSDIVNAAKKLTKVTNRKVTTWGFYPQRGNQGQYDVMHLRQFGSDLLSSNGKSTPADDSKAQASYQYQWDLIYKDKVAPSGSEYSPVNTVGAVLQGYFAAGSLAMYEDVVGAISSMDAFVKGAFEWGVFPIPTGPGGSRGGTMFLSTTQITRQSSSPEAAWQFLKLITDKEIGVQKVLTGSGTPGARPDVYTDPRLAAKWPAFKVLPKLMVEAGHFNTPWNYRSGEMYSNVFQNDGGIWTNAYNGQAGAKKNATSIRAVLGEPTLG